MKNILDIPGDLLFNVSVYLKLRCVLYRAVYLPQNVSPL